MERAEEIDANEALQLRLSVPFRVIHLPMRAQNAIANLGIRYVGELLPASPADLLRVPNFGRKSLVEVAAALERLGLQFGQEVSGWSAASAEQLNRDHAAIILRLAARASGQVSEREFCGDLAEALRRAVADAEPSDRNVGMVVRYLGWDGQGGSTLEEVGAPFRLTRERVRQIVARSLRLLENRSPPMEARMAVELVNTRNLMTASELDAALREANLTKRPFGVHGLRTMAEAFDLHPNFEQGGRRDRALVLPLNGAALVDQLPVAARKIISARGCVDVRALAEDQVPQLARGSDDFLIEIMEQDGDFLWLDDKREWAWRGPHEGRNRLINDICKVLAVAPRVDIAELRRAIRRDLRMGGFAPPTDILGAVCEHLPFARLEGRLVQRVEDAIEWSTVLGETEATFVKVLRKHGPVMHRSAFLKACLEEGMNENTFTLYGTYSVVLTRPTQGFYALTGAYVPPGLIEQQRRSVRRHSALIESGWTKDGRPFVAWRITQAVLGSGIVSIPAGIRDLLSGNWSLETTTGEPLGVIEVRQATCWNLRKLFKHAGAEVDDVLVLWFELADRSVSAAIGDDDLIDATPDARFANLQEDAESV